MDACHQTRNRRDSLNSGQLFRGPENARRVCMRWSHVVEQNKLGHLFESKVLRLMRVVAYTRLTAGQMDMLVEHALRSTLETRKGGIKYIAEEETEMKNQEETVAVREKLEM